MDNSVNEGNVFDIKTRQRILPVGLRALIMSQYITSREADHGAEDFVNNLEDQLSTWAVSAVIDSARKAVSHLNQEKK